MFTCSSCFSTDLKTEGIPSAYFAVPTEDVKSETDVFTRDSQRPVRTPTAVFSAPNSFLSRVEEKYLLGHATAPTALFDAWLYVHQPV